MLPGESVSASFFINIFCSRVSPFIFILWSSGGPRSCFYLTILLKMHMELKYIICVKNEMGHLENAMLKQATSTSMQSK